MAAARKVIITCAVTGAGHTPTMSPALPYSVEDVVGQSVAAVEAGAAIIHLHARDPKDGRPTADPAVFLEYLKGIKDSTDAVVSITSGGGTGMSVAERLQVIYETRPELCTLNLGTFNYGSFPMIPKYAGSWKHRLGGAVPREHADRAVREHVRRHRAHAHRRPRRRPVLGSSTRPTTSATSTRSRTTSTPVWSSRRSSCRRSSA